MNIRPIPPQEFNGVIGSTPTEMQKAIALGLSQPLRVNLSDTRSCHSKYIHRVNSANGRLFDRMA